MMNDSTEHTAAQAPGFALRKGCATVIAGPEGSGKTTLARELAGAHGSFIETDARVLISPFHLGHALANKPATIIVDEVPARLITTHETRRMIADERVVLHRKGRPEEVVATPQFIFCTRDADELRLHPADARLHIVWLTGNKPGEDNSGAPLGVGAESLPLQVIANAVARHLPRGFTVSLHIESGSAWVELTRNWRKPLHLPDAADKTLVEQLHEAILAARNDHGRAQLNHDKAA